jgi:hypothetical protein
VHDGAKDDWSNDHLDELDEGVPERLHLRAKLRIKMAECDADHDGRQHLHIEALVKRLAVRCSCRHHFCVSHMFPLCYGAGCNTPAFWRSRRSPGNSRRGDRRQPRNHFHPAIHVVLFDMLVERRGCPA